MVCKEADAELESISSKEPIDASGTSYLVFLCYGTADAEDLAERLHFVLVSGEEILYDEECVTITETENHKYISNIPLNGMKSVDAIMVIGFKMHTGKEGQLYVDYDKGGRKVLLRTPVGTVDDGTEVVVDDMTVGYLTEENYNDGDFEDEKITATPNFETDQPVYLVLGVDLSTKQENEGDLVLTVHINFPGLSKDGITVEAAPTIDIKMNERNGILDVCTIYKIPQEKDGVKNVRMILRINQPRAVEDGVHLLLTSNQAVSMLGTTYMPDLLTGGVSFQEFVPDWQKNTMANWRKNLIFICALIILFCATLAITVTFTENPFWKHLLLVAAWVGTVIPVIFILCLKTFAWWVILINILIIYAVMTLPAVVVARLMDGEGKGSLPTLIGILVSTLISSLVLSLMSTIWWIPLMISAGSSIVIAVICGFIGYRRI